MEPEIKNGQIVLVRPVQKSSHPWQGKGCNVIQARSLSVRI